MIQFKRALDPYTDLLDRGFDPRHPVTLKIRTNVLDGSTVRLRTKHTASGNPVRFATGPVVLRPDTQWRSSQGRTDRAVVTALSLPWLRRYEYPVSSGLWRDSAVDGGGSGSSG